MKLGLIALMLLMFATIVAAEPSLDVGVRISQNNIVTQKTTVIFEALKAHDFVDFTTFEKPLSVVYDGEYDIVQDGGAYVISFQKVVVQGQNEISFELLFDNHIVESGRQRIYRASFAPPENGTTNISLTLPPGFALSEKKPNSIPKPDSITTDGRSITLSWRFQEPAEVSVFYEAPQDSSFIFLLPIVFAIILAAGLFFYFKRKTRKYVSEMLSTEENKVVEAVRSGATKQKEIALQLDFSKSKMSKVTRRLEEKGLVERTPHFKTNIIKLKEKIK